MLIMNNVEASRTVGIVGKNHPVIDVFRQSLASRGMNLKEFEDRNALLASTQAEPRPDILILSEKTAIKGIKDIPRIVLGSGEKGAAETALNKGACDYISTRGEKPKDVADYVAAKINRLAQRGIWEPAVLPPVITVDGISIDIGRNKLTVDGKPVAIRLRCFMALSHLIQNADLIINHDELVSRLMLEETLDPHHSVRQCVSEAKTKLGSKKNHIVNIWGEGYMFATSPEAKKSANV